MDFPELSPAEQDKMDAFSRALNNMLEKIREKERLGLFDLVKEEPAVPDNPPQKPGKSRRKNEPKS